MKQERQVWKKTILNSAWNLNEAKGLEEKGR